MFQSILKPAISTLGIPRAFAWRPAQLGILLACHVRTLVSVTSDIQRNCLICTLNDVLTGHVALLTVYVLL